MRDERTDGWKAGRLEGLRDGQTDNPEVICPLNFFEVGRGRGGGGGAEEVEKNYR